MANGSFVRRVMAGDNAWSLPLRGVLNLCSRAYAAGVAARNARYDRGEDVHRVSVPVISVGNITTGGTGKTPLVIEVARRLQDRGRQVAVLSRGYKAPRGGLADELLLVSRRLPGVVCTGDPDRVAGAERLIRDQHVDAIVLDDAFQHRRLARDLDIVAIDATNPFGYGHLLPRGMLREPGTSVARAHLLVITRCDQVAEVSIEHLVTTLNSLSPSAPVLRSRHKPTSLTELDGREAAPMLEPGARVLAFSAIGNPDAFERTLASTRVELVGRHRFNDHHAYNADDLRRLAGEAERLDCTTLITTEKDAVKLVGLEDRPQCRILALGIDMEFLDHGGGELERALGRVLESVKSADTGA